MLPAVITLQFEPTIEIAGRLVRWETIALAAVIVAALLLAAWLAGRAGPARVPHAAAPAAEDGEAVANEADAPDSGAPSGRTVLAVDGSRLRRDDMLYIVIGAIPGAVIGGRILHAVTFLDYYLNVDTPSALLDPGRGSLSLMGAVIGGTLTAAYVGWLIGAPLRRWLDVAIVPLLLAIGLGKLAELLGGGGQGAISDGPWAVAFAGGGPWRSLGADLPAHPSQVYEGAWALAGILLVGFFAAPFVWRRMPVRLRDRPTVDRDLLGRSRYDTAVEELPPPGSMAPGFLFGLGLGWWALGRVVVGFTWRDDPVLAGLNVEQVAAVVVLAILVALFVRAVWPRGGESE